MSPPQPVQRSKSTADSTWVNSAPNHLEFSPSAVIKRSSSSSQVQESYWSPKVSPAAVRHRSPFTTTASHRSSQQRQLSIERAYDQEQTSPNAVDEQDTMAETSVWDYFKFYEHCATSDF